MRVYMIGCDCMYSDQARCTAGTHLLLRARSLSRAVPPSNASAGVSAITCLTAALLATRVVALARSVSPCITAAALWALGKILLPLVASIPSRRQQDTCGHSFCQARRQRTGNPGAKDEDVQAQNKTIVSTSMSHSLSYFFLNFKCPSTTGRVARCVAYMFRSRRA